MAAVICSGVKCAGAERGGDPGGESSLCFLLLSLCSSSRRPENRFYYARGECLCFGFGGCHGNKRSAQFFLRRSSRGEMSGAA
jgi:hypothetical protein